MLRRPCAPLKFVSFIFKFFIVATALLAPLLTSSEAFACKCDRIDPPREAYMGFFGTVEEITPRGSTDRAVFRVEQVYKGPEDKETVSVTVNRFRHDCGIRFEVGKSYVVYAMDFHPRGVATSMCWRTYEAESAPTPQEFKKPKGKIAEPTEVEKELRKIVQRITARCGGATRVKDAGFSFILSPTGDPVRVEPEEQLSPRIEEFQRCVVDHFLAVSDLPTPDAPVLIEGWWQYGDRHAPVLLDERPCEEPCMDWGQLVRVAMLAVPGHGTGEEDPTFERTLADCIEGGVDSVANAPTTGSRGKSRRHTRMLMECTVARGEFDKTLELVEGDNLDAGLVAAAKWGARNSAEGKYPIGTGRPHYDTVYFEQQEIKDPSPGDYRILRNSFVASDRWSDQPLYLEAFAQAILQDESVPDEMRDIAAVAYHRASLLRPELEAEYRQLAAEASDSQRATMMNAEVTKTLEAAANPPQPESDGDDDIVADSDMADQASAESDDQMLLYVAAGLLLLAMVGIFLLKTRR